VKTVRYKNPWHSKRDRFSKSHFETDARPIKYGDCIIYHRIRSTSKGGDVWDVVLNGLCVTQRAGLNGAKQAIDNRDWEQRRWWKERKGAGIGAVLRVVTGVAA